MKIISTGEREEKGEKTRGVQKNSRSEIRAELPQGERWSEAAKEEKGHRPARKRAKGGNRRGGNRTALHYRDALIAEAHDGKGGKGPLTARVIASAEGKGR